MPQILKDDTRDAILRSALSLFARSGYRDTSLQAVALGAGISVGNLYRYFTDKKALYEAAVPPGLLLELTSSLDRKFAAWKGFPLTVGSGMSKQEKQFQRELISMLTANRLHWVILLRDGFEEVLVDRLTDFFTRWAREGKRKISLDDGRIATVRVLYRNLTRLIGSVLSEREDLTLLERGLTECLDYHMAGLAVLTESWRNR